MKSPYIVLGLKCCLVTAVVLGLLVWTVGAKMLTPNHRLVQAAGYGDLALVKAELDNGADINAKSGGSTALMVAVQAGHVAIARFLLSKRADVSIRGNGGATALLIACRQQDSLPLMKLLLEKGADPNATTADGLTALKTAMDNGQPEMVKCLLDSGADVNARLKDGSTALMWASLTGNEDFVQLLIAKGADVNAKAGNGSTALAWAAIMERNNLAKLLVVSGARMTLPIAAALGDKKAAEWLIHLGADVNRKDEYGQTPLMNARERGHQDIVELLKERGASQ